MGNRCLGKRLGVMRVALEGRVSDKRSDEPSPRYATCKQAPRTGLNSMRKPRENSRKLSLPSAL